MKHVITNTKKFARHIILIIFIILLIIITIISSKKNKNSNTNTSLNPVQSNIESAENNYSDSSEKTVVVVLSEDSNSESTSISSYTSSMLSSSSSTKSENNNTSPYYIKVNNACNVVTIYGKDSNGKYTVAKKAMICSIGTSTPTSGVYSTSDKYVWRKLVGDVYGQYATRITGSILFHSVPYEKQDKSTLEWWEYDLLGKKASKGCVRLTVEDAKWIYDNCPKGTKVEFYSSSNPGPLGKPTAKKISSYEGVRVWDPTDPDKNNPWLTYNSNQNSSNSSSSRYNSNSSNSSAQTADKTDQIVESQSNSNTEEKNSTQENITSELESSYTTSLNQTKQSESTNIDLYMEDEKNE